MVKSWMDIFGFCCHKNYGEEKMWQLRFQVALFCKLALWLCRVIYSLQASALHRGVELRDFRGSCPRITEKHWRMICSNYQCAEFFSIYFISWRLITLQYRSGFCHILTWISHGFTCIPHPDPPSHLPLHPIPLGLPSAPGPSTCLMHPTWAGDLFFIFITK